MALANIGVILAKWGYKTLAIDWDLEAPGLETYYKEIIDLTKVKDKPGLIDLLVLKNNDPTYDPNNINWHEYINVVDIEKNQNLHLISSGKKDANYADKVREFDFESFYEKRDGGEFLENLREYWLKNYNFILIDSRTGLTDSSGICSIHMPDILLLMFTPNEQSFDGIKKASKEAIEGQRDQVFFDRSTLRTVPIPCRIEHSETILLDSWMDKISNESDDMLEWLPKGNNSKSKYTITPKQLFSQIQIPYKTLYAYGETLAVLNRDTKAPSELGYTYETLAAIIANDLQSIHLLADSRDSLLKKAKGEEIFDQTGLKEKITSIEKEKEGLKDALEENIKAQQRKENTAKWVRIALLISLLLAGTASAIAYWVDQKNSQKSLDTFMKSFANINKLTGRSRNYAICKLASFDNAYNDPKIANLVDSLSTLCSNIEEDQRIIMLATDTLRLLNKTKSIPQGTLAKGVKIDNIDNRINLLKDSIQKTKDKGKQLKLRKDSVNLEIAKQTIINTDTLLTKAAVPIQKLQAAIQQTQAISNDNNSGSNYISSGWFKPGYYLQFENIKVLLKGINKPDQSISVEICDMIGPAVCVSPIAVPSIGYDTAYNFAYGKFNYKITLDKIGHGGSNPFTIAAYVTFTKTPQ
jgi:hypothetical protein